MEEESEQTKYKTKASTQKEKQVKDFDKKKKLLFNIAASAVE
jgi:hypothetical protein